MPDPTEGHSPLPWGLDKSRMFLVDREGNNIMQVDDVANWAANRALVMREVSRAPQLRDRVKELEALCARAETVIGWLIPAIGSIAIPDHAELDNVCCDLAEVKPKEAPDE